MVHTAPQQVERLIRRLAGPDVAFFIHVDRKSPQAVRAEIAERVQEIDHCTFLPSQAVRWAHFSQIEVTLHGLEAVERSGLDPDQTALITGQHYPISPNSQITELLRDPSVAYMQHEPLPNYEWWPADRGGLDRFERVHVWIPRRGSMKPLPFIKRALPAGYRPRGGSAYWSLGRRHRRYVLEVLHKDQELMRCFRHSRAGDEVLFQTIVMSSSLGESVVNDNLVFAVWPPGALRPNTLTSADFDSLAQSSKLFARKVDEDVDVGLLDRIDRELLSV
jgi:hypothetical protein